MTNLRNIRLMIAFMVLALLGLGGFQWYWIENALSMRKEQFDRNVQEALSETARKVEKQEILFLTQQKQLATQQRQLLAISQNKAPKPIATPKPQRKTNEELAQPQESFVRVTPSDILIEQHFEITDQQISNLKDWLHQREEFYDEEYLTDRILEQHRQIENGVENVQENIEKYVYQFKNMPEGQNSISVDIWENKPEEAKQKIEKKSNLVKDVLREIISNKRDIYQRVNRQMLDTLLREELRQRGITIPYEYGIKNGSNMVFSSFDLNYNSQKLKNAYKTTLFPNDLNSQNHFLYVDLPQRQNFILRNMWWLFLSSIALIMMVGGVFYRSISTILKQKKLSDITNDFINNMTHEFKTPISTISLATQVLQDKEVSKNPEKVNRYLNVIQDENQRLGTHVEKVLQMALLDRGEVRLYLETLNIHEIIERVLHNLGLQIEQKGGVIHLALNAENPEIQADSLHLTNIIYNLVDNAHKYSTESPEISISTENTPEGLKVCVADKGIGMSKEQLSKIFDKFYRIPTGNLHDVKGFGLGLSYVKKMLEVQNARISVASKLGEGSTFEVLFMESQKKDAPIEASSL